MSDSAWRVNAYRKILHVHAPYQQPHIVLLLSTTTWLQKPMPIQYISTSDFRIDQVQSTELEKTGARQCKNSHITLNRTSRYEYMLMMGERKNAKNGYHQRRRLIFFLIGLGGEPLSRAPRQWGRRRHREQHRRERHREHHRACHRGHHQQPSRSWS